MTSEDIVPVTLGKDAAGNPEHQESIKEHDMIGPLDTRYGSEYLNNPMHLNLTRAARSPHPIASLQDVLARYDFLRHRRLGRSERWCKFVI